MQAAALLAANKNPTREEIVTHNRKSGKIKVLNFWAALDAGIAVQPINLAAQTEGSIIYALGHVLREKIDIEDGRVLQSNYSDYQVARMSDVPHIEIKVSRLKPSYGWRRGRRAAGCLRVRQRYRQAHRGAAARAAILARPNAWGIGGLGRVL
jgi:hypothetical protein